MCLAQWYVPGKLILDEEKILSEGKVFKFKTAPVDPSDPFRGKYITLSFEENSIKIVNPDEWKNAKRIYVSLEDSAGYALISTVSMYEPENADYVKAEIQYISDYDTTLYIRYPFERFYLEESKASEAEKLYWEAQRDSSVTAYAEVSILEGNAALKDVFINSRSVKEIVKEINREK